MKKTRPSAGARSEKSCVECLKPQLGPVTVDEVACQLLPVDLGLLHMLLRSNAQQGHPRASRAFESGGDGQDMRALTVPLVLNEWLLRWEAKESAQQRVYSLRDTTGLEGF